MQNCKSSVGDGEYSPAIGKLLHEGWHAGESKDRQHSKGKLGRGRRMGLRDPALTMQPEGRSGAGF